MLAVFLASVSPKVNPSSGVVQKYPSQQ